MSHKTLVKVAIVMIVVFGLISIVYPMVFSPEGKVPGAPSDAPMATPTEGPPPAAPTPAGQ